MTPAPPPQPDADLDGLDTSLLEPVLRKLVREIGLVHTLRLVEHGAGLPLYIPKNPVPGHWLEQLVGMQAARRVAEMFGGESPVLPRALPALRALRDRQMRAVRDSTSVRGLARAHGLGRRRVQQILAGGDEAGDRGPQERLFDE